MITKPKGIHATFAVDCPKCREELTVTNGRHDPHDCRPRKPTTLAEIQAALDNRTKE